jgi:hypothetical protein
VGDTTQAVRLPQDGIEDWREVAGRGIDDLQNLCGGGLLGVSLEQEGQVATLRAQVAALEALLPPL